jgi:RNA polymerase sigma-70 factor (ECF subfamily)
MTDALDATVLGEPPGVRKQNVAREENVPREEGFDALVKEHSRFVFRVAFAALGNVQDAEDATQEVFLKIYRSRVWDGIMDARAFLARATWRVAASRRPRRKSESLAEHIPDHRANPERAAMVAHSEALVHRLIDALPDKLRQPLALSAMEELDSSSIGKILGIPESTVRGRILQARELLKRKLAAQLEKRNG